MNSRFLVTHQQRQYERVYQGVTDQYGFPDRKISDGQILKGKRILSLGCGTGNDVWYLADENLVVGLDYAMSGLKVGKQHGLQAVAADLNHPVLPFADQSFDVVICKDILEHLVEPLAVLQEVRRVSQGRRLCGDQRAEPFLFSPLRLRILFGKGLIWKSIGSDHGREYDEWNYMHIRFFTYKGFRRFLRAAGFRAEKWFWDFGNLAHYNNPDMWLEPQLWKKAHRKPISRRGKIALYVIRPLWKVFNILFPKPLRSFILSLSPGLPCAGFYVRVKKEVL